MCGIAGYIDRTGQTGQQVIEKMTNVISHRGPDGFGYKLLGNVALGHRRRSIIDLETGAQPICNEDQTIWVTFNGELYNFRALRSELISLGHKFATNSDTEVIVHAYEQWKQECVKRFRGMFAFGLVDTVRRTCFLARDHFGIKPLYIYKSAACIAFGSEIQQFKTIKGFDRELDLMALDQYLWLQYIPAPLTIFKSVEKLKPAHYVFVDFDGNIGSQTEYWNVDFSKKEVRTETEWLEATEAVINESVREHMISDVSFGAFLSGGVDSSLVVEHMTRNLNRKVKTFSIGFEEEDYNELSYSKIVAEKWGTDHHTEIVRPDALSLLPHLVAHYGEPYGDSSCIHTYYVCRLARQLVTMTLSGDGGDECFAGYNSYINWIKHMPVQYRKGVKRSLYPYLQKLFPANYPAQDTLHQWLPLIEALDTNWRSQLWRPELEKYLSTTPIGFDKLFDHTRKSSTVNKVQYMDMKTYMPGDILTKVDVASMMHSLEVRTPLIDVKVWEFAATIPEEFLISNKSGEWTGKILLKKLLERNFPHDFVYRRKKGFAVPLSRWFSSNGEYRMVVEESLLSERSVLGEFFETKSVEKLIHSANSGGIWQLLFLEEWLRQFKSDT